MAGSDQVTVSELIRELREIILLDPKAAEEPVVFLTPAEGELSEVNYNGREVSVG